MYVFIPAMLLLMYRKGMDLEILLGFFFILTMSDSRLSQLAFAASFKNIYILIIALISLKEMRALEFPIGFYKYFVAFIVVAIVCVIFSPTMGLAFQKTVSYILLLVSVPNYFLFVYKKYGSLLFKAIIFFISLLLLLGLIYNYVDPQVTTLVGRFRGFLGNPNGLGLFTFLAIMFFATLNEHYKNMFTRNEKIIVYGLTFFCLLKCGARGSLVATLLFFFFKKFYKLSPVLGFIIFILTIFVYQIVSENLIDIIVAFGLGDELRVETLENGSGRIIAWKFAWQHIQDNFYIGSGFSYTEYLFRQNYEYLSKLGHQGAAHNAYLTIWLDTGLVGLVAFSGGLMVTFFKASKYSKLAIPILYAILFSNYYESWITASLNPFTIQLLFTLTIIFMLDAKYDSESDAKEEKEILTPSPIP